MPYGTLIYNGYQFGEFTHTVVAGEQQFADDERGYKGTRYTLQATAVVTAQAGDTDAGDHFERVRKQLCEPGKRLQIDDLGFGPVDIEADMEFGPHPRIINWTPIGNRWTVEFIWSVSFFVSETCAPVFGDPQNPPVISFTYSIAFSLNRSGHTTRTVSGYLEIANGRDPTNINEPITVVDSYRTLIDVAIPEAFRRERQDYTSNAAKTRLDFVIVDREIESPEPYPEGVIDIEATHSAGRNYRDASQINHGLQVTLELAQDQPRLRAWEVFQAIYASLVGEFAQTSSLFFDHLHITEGLFNNRYTFDAQFRYLNGDILSMIRDQGFYSRFLNGQFDWAAWATSLATNVTDPRGLAKLDNTPGEDRIVDPCETEIPTIGGTPNYPTIPPLNNYPRIQNTQYTPDRSWSHFEATLSEQTEYKKARSYELGPVEVISEPFDKNASGGNLSQVNGLNSLETVVSDAAPNMLWRWQGYAERWGYPIGSPDLATVDGNAQLEKVGNDKFWMRNAGVIYGVTKYVAGWDFLYLTRERPETPYTGNLNPNPDGG